MLESTCIPPWQPVTNTPLYQDQVSKDERADNYQIHQAGVRTIKNHSAPVPIPIPNAIWNRWQVNKPSGRASPKLPLIRPSDRIRRRRISSQIPVECTSSPLAPPVTTSFISNSDKKIEEGYSLLYHQIYIFSCDYPLAVIT